MPTLLIMSIIRAVFVAVASILVAGSGVLPGNAQTLAVDVRLSGAEDLVYGTAGVRPNLRVEAETPAWHGFSVVGWVEFKERSDSPLPDGAADRSHRLGLAPRYRLAFRENWAWYVDVVPMTARRAGLLGSGVVAGRGNLGSPSDWRWGTGVEAPVTPRLSARLGVDYNRAMPAHAAGGVNRSWGTAMGFVLRP